MTQQGKIYFFRKCPTTHVPHYIVIASRPVSSKRHVTPANHGVLAQGSHTFFWVNELWSKQSLVYSRMQSCLKQTPPHLWSLVYISIDCDKHMSIKYIYISLYKWLSCKEKCGPYYWNGRENMLQESQYERAFFQGSIKGKIHGQGDCHQLEAAEDIPFKQRKTHRSKGHTGKCKCVQETSWLGRWIGAKR